METIKEAILMAMDEIKKEYGENKKLEDGDEFTTVFNDGIIILGMEDKELEIKILVGKPYFVDYDLNLLDEC